MYTCVYIFPCTYTRIARGVHCRHIVVNVDSTHVNDVPRGMTMTSVLDLLPVVLLSRSYIIE